MEFQWITPAKAIDNPKLFKAFQAKNIVSAVLEISGLGLYRAYLNGKRVGNDYLTPGFNDYDAYVRYQTYDVTDLLQEDNCLEVMLGNGWYKGRFGFGKEQYNRWGDKYLLTARLTLKDTQGETAVIVTDDTWQACASCILDNSIYDGERRDDTREAGEIVPCVVTKAHYPLEPQFSPPIRVRAELKPQLIITPKGEKVLDFGQNLAGVIRFVNRLPKGETLHIQTGEVLQNDCFYRDNLRSALSEYFYTSDGVEKEVEQVFTFYGFRYAKVEGLENVNPEDFTAVALCSDLTETLQCETGHPLINQLMKNTLWGQRSNFLDVPTDCPQRDERLGWTGDTQVFCNTACYQMDCKDFYRKFMRDMREDQVRYCGGDLPKVSPSLRGLLGNGGAVWSDAGTIVPWNVYMNYGDEKLLRENYPVMRDYVEYLIRHDQKKGGSHVIFDCHTFADWLSMDGLTPQYTWGGTKKEYIQGAYYMYSVELTAKAARVLGEDKDAEKYEKLAAEIKEALLDEYVSPNGNLTIDTQTAFTLALRYGIYRNKEKMIQGFKHRLSWDFYKIMGGFTGAPLILPVLFDHGMGDIAMRMLLSEEFPGWLYCVKLGATTIWERWNSLNPDGSISGTGMNSLNHYAYGTVCEAIYSRIMGLRCAAPGWKKAVIHPYLDGRIGHASIRYASYAGDWEVKWKIHEDGTASLCATVPEGAEAEIILPDHPENFAAHVGPGTYEYTWQPTKDYLHPFSVDSLMIDLLENEEARRVLEEVKGDIAQDGQTTNKEILLNTVRELSNHILSAIQEVRGGAKEDALAELDQKLRAIHV